MSISVLRVIYLALVGGAACFLMVAAALAGPPKLEVAVLLKQPVGIVLTVIALTQIVAAITATAWYPEFVRRKLESDAVREKDLAHEIARSYGTYVILGASLAEGAVLLAGIGFLLSGHMAPLLLGVLAIAVCLYVFPSERGAVAFGRRVTGKHLRDDR